MRFQIPPGPQFNGSQLSYVEQYAQLGTAESFPDHKN
jgi:hypothetical protein